MSVNKPNFLDYVHREGNNVNNFFESYFYLEGITGKLGIHKFELIDKNASNIKLQAYTPSMTGLEVIKNIVKIFSYLTIVVPVVMLIGKTILRQKHNYTIFSLDAAIKSTENKQIAQVEKITQTWKKGEIAKKPIPPEKKTAEVPSSNDAPSIQKVIEQRKEETSKYVKDALNLIGTFREQMEKGVIGLERAETEDHDIETYRLSIDGIPFEKKYFKKYGFTTWQFEKNGQKFEVNEYEPNAYNGPKTEDFIEQQRVLINGAKKYVSELPIKDETTKNAAQEKIEGLLNLLDQKFLKDIRQKDCLIDPKLMRDSEKDEACYFEVHAQAKKLLGQLARDIQFVINDVSLKADPKCKNFDLYALEQAGKEYVISRGRPTIINTYFINDSKNQQKQFFSMQRPASSINEKGERIAQEVLPCTVRDRPGLVNYVITSSGKLVSKDGTLQAKILFEGIRHTSYSPITLRNPYQREYIACRNCKQNLIDLAASIVKNQPDVKTDPSKPLVIPLRTMMLLTPKKGDALRNRKKYFHGKWTGDSESFQMEESALALKMYHNRVMKVNIEGKGVWIKPEISFMNLGANKYALSSKLDSESLFAYNAKGFLDFQNEVLEFVGRYTEKNQEVKKLLEDISLYGKSDQRLKKTKTYIQTIQQKNNSRLVKLYSELEELMGDYLNNEEAINRKKEEIYQIESIIYNGYKHFFRLVKPYKAEKMKHLFEKVKLNLASDPDLEPENKQKLENILIKFEYAMTLFHSKAYRKVDTILDFQVFYLNINEMMSNFVESFCKSAKDRTGRLDDKVQENMVFEENTSRPPTSPQEKKYVDTKIAPLVHQYSASQNNAEQNTGGRGEQIGPKVNPNLPAKIEKKHAALVKKLFKKAEKLNPSPWIIAKAA